MQSNEISILSSYRSLSLTVSLMAVVAISGCGRIQKINTSQISFQMVGIYPSMSVASAVQLLGTPLSDLPGQLSWKEVSVLYNEQDVIHTVRSAKILIKGREISTGMSFEAKTYLDLAEKKVSNKRFLVSRSDRLGNKAYFELDTSSADKIINIFIVGRSSLQTKSDNRKERFLTWKNKP